MNDPDPLPWIGFVHDLGDDGQRFFVRFPQERSPDLEAEFELANHNVEFGAMPELGQYVELTADSKLRPHDVGCWMQEEINAIKARARELAERLGFAR